MSSDKYDMRPEYYVVGDLVYYTGYTYVAELDKRKLGVVIDIDNRASHFVQYKVFWISDNIASVHVGNHLELVYNENS